MIYIKKSKYYSFKNLVRRKTLEVFYKKNQCEFCLITDRKTTRHHKIYKMPPALKRRDIIELCSVCHNKLELELIAERKANNMLPRELRNLK